MVDNSLKNTAANLLLSLLLVVSSLAKAGAPKDNAALVVIPSLSPQYEISGSFLLLQPTSSSLDYGIHTQPLPIYNPHWNIQSINHDYQAAFNVGLGYTIGKSSNDIQAKWTRFTDSDSGGIGVLGNDFVGPFFEIGPDTGSIKHVSGESKFKYNLIDLDIGQFINFGCRLQMRLFTGLSSVFITQHLSARFTNNAGNNATDPITPDPSFSMEATNISKYAGVGPRFGLNATYHFSPQFGLVAQIAGSAFVGRIRTSTEFLGTSNTNVSQFGITENPQSINADNANRLVPGTEGKLGLIYICSPFKNMVAKVEGGYQFAAYFNAIRQIFPTTLAEIDGDIVPIQSGGIFVGTMGQSQSHFTLGGAYLTLSVTL